MTKRLIVNADDFGFSSLVSQGILEAHRDGIVTSTSVMIGYPNSASDLEAALRDAPTLGYGLHLVVTGGGKPVSDPHTIPTLLSDAGTFPAPDYWWHHPDQVNPAEVEREVRAQFDKFVQVAGRLPDHLDCHHHSLYGNPATLPILLNLARDHDLPIRRVGDGVDVPGVVMPDRLAAGFYEKTATVGDLLLILTEIADGTTELMCHPGYLDEALNDPYREPRVPELRALTHKSARELIAAEGIQLIRFSDLARSQ